MNKEDMSQKSLTSLLNKSIGFVAADFMKIALTDFSSIKSIFKIATGQKAMADIRNRYEDQGVHVPPFMIASITSFCNLKCKGCYDRAKHHNGAEEIDENEWSDIFAQAKELGISFILLAGGEPLIKKNIIMQCAKYPEIVFPIFTNGLLIDESWTEYFASNRNIIPVLSIEGDKEETDGRRGEGVFDRLSVSFELLKKKRIFYGTSITLTSRNYDYVLSDDFIKSHIASGCRMFFYVQYVPFDPSTEGIVLSDDKRAELAERLDKYRAKYKALFFDFPGDERTFGGCLAAGRGFVHINATGAVEACPFAPYSDVNLKNMKLKDALKSPVLKEIRELHGTLENHKGGCTLFENKEAVDRFIKNK